MMPNVCESCDLRGRCASDMENKLSCEAARRCNGRVKEIDDGDGEAVSLMNSGSSRITSEGERGSIGSSSSNSSSLRAGGWMPGSDMVGCGLICTIGKEREREVEKV